MIYHEPTAPISRHPLARFIVVSSGTPRKGAWGTYRRVAILEIEPGANPHAITMISARARGVRRVVETWESMSTGDNPMGDASERNAFAAALQAAHERCAAHNGDDPAIVQSAAVRAAIAASVPRDLIDEISWGARYLATL